MSVDNFIPTIWSGSFISELEKVSVATLPLVVNRNWEGDLQNSDTVKINQIGDITVSDYTKNSTTVTYSALQSAGLLLKADQRKYFSFAIDNVDKAQAKGDIQGLGMQKAAYKVKDTKDSYVLTTMAAGAGVTTDLGTTASPLTVTAADSTGSYTGIVDLLSLIGAALDTSNCPTDGRFLIVPPAIYRKIIKASVLDIRSTMQQQDATTSGNVQNALGFTILKSNNVVNAGTSASPKWKVLAGHSLATTYADQITLIEAFRLQAQIGDGVRGLFTYGAKVVDGNALACATCAVGST